MKKRTTKITITLLIALAFSLSVVGCREQKKEDVSNNQSTEAESTEKVEEQESSEVEIETESESEEPTESQQPDDVIAYGTIIKDVAVIDYPSAFEYGIITSLEPGKEIAIIGEAYDEEEKVREW